MFVFYALSANEALESQVKQLEATVANLSEENSSLVKENASLVEEKANRIAEVRHSVSCKLTSTPIFHPNCNNICQMAAPYRQQIQMAASAADTSFCPGHF